MSIRPLLFVPFVFVPACADGGKEEAPPSEVQIAASHHLFGFRSLRGFGPFPVPPTAVFTTRGRLNLFADSTYTLTDSNGTSQPDRYALANPGQLSIYVTGGGTEPTVVFRGGYSRVGTQADLCFTDRVVSGASPSIGLYYGTRVVEGQVELAGGWHLLSLHAVFAGSNPTIGFNNVGRGARGGVTITPGDPGTQRTVSGTGRQSIGLRTAANLTFGGTIQNLLDAQNSGDGTCNLDVSYQIDGEAADGRSMDAFATDNVVFGLDFDEADGEAGILFLVRKFDAPTTPVDSVRVLGTFLVGGHTLFANPSNSGSDAFVGVVTLGQNNAFRLDATGNSGQDFTYTGTYSLAGDGGMTISIPATDETWFAAIDRTYNTLVFVDDFLEQRASNSPELNLGFGVRRKPD